MMRVSSIFSQMLQLFSRAERAVIEHRAERHARGFSCWGQFVAMLFCHLGRAQSLREICGGLAASEGTWACQTRPSAPPWPMPTNIGPGSCTAACSILLGRCREVAGTHGFRFKNKLLSLAELASSHPCPT